MQQVDDVMMIAGVQDYVEERSLFRLDKDWLAGGGAEPSCCQPGANAKDSVFVHTKEISTPRKMLIRTGSRSVYHFFSAPDWTESAKGRRDGAPPTGVILSPRVWSPHCCWIAMSILQA